MSGATVTLHPRIAFALIELLLVVGLIGILATTAIPSFQNTKGRANAAALRGDLRNLAVAQEAYFYDHPRCGVPSSSVPCRRLQRSKGFPPASEAGSHMTMFNDHVR